jgi:hypothetical protein
VWNALCLGIDSAGDDRANHCGPPFSCRADVVDAATAQESTYLLSVSRHYAVPDLSEREIKGILARASKMLQKDSSHNRDDDVGCNVTFTFKGSVGTFASPDTPVVDRDNLAAVHRVDSNVAEVDFT